LGRKLEQEKTGGSVSRFPQASEDDLLEREEDRGVPASSPMSHLAQKEDEPISNMQTGFLTEDSASPAKEEGRKNPFLVAL